MVPYAVILSVSCSPCSCALHVSLCRSIFLHGAYWLWWWKTVALATLPKKYFCRGLSPCPPPCPIPPCGERIRVWDVISAIKGQMGFGRTAHAPRARTRGSCVVRFNGDDFDVQLTPVVFVFSWLIYYYSPKIMEYTYLSTYFLYYARAITIITKIIIAVVLW